MAKKRLKTIEIAWALRWVSKEREHLIGAGWECPMTHTFKTYSEAAAFKREHYGYIAKRKDLREPPHEWRSPQIVRVKITIEEVK